jgi:cellulose synthase/poly-beta-1,6-N-acetylglucosamine synthase-like glycosyltransferase
LNNYIHIFVPIYSFFGSAILIGYVFQSKKERKETQRKYIDINNLIVIIPFRNEELRIKNLIDCINNLTLTPRKFIFVNDHSEDNTIEIINNLKSTIPFEILNLSNSLKGKKAAIRHAISHQKSEYNLTWDADICIEPSYFEHISKIQKKDLTILPVIMKGDNFLGNYFESDYSIANAINTSVNGWKRPFLASGANLLFNQKSFIESDNYKSHAHIHSGDDMFLLRDFRLKNKDIELISSKKLAVTTESPKTISEFFQQRLRWINKSPEIKDQLSNSLAILSLIFNLLFISTYIYVLIRQEWKLFFICFGIKSIIDLLVYLPYFYKIKRLKTWIGLPLFALIQPVYLSLLLVMMLFYKPTWKGRK